MKKMTKKKLVPLCILLPCMVFASGARLLADELPDEVKSVNHRGYNTVAPENTLPAFELSKENGFHYVETDISFTKDNVPVLLHDDTINRTARNRSMQGGRIAAGGLYVGRDGIRR